MTEEQVPVSAPQPHGWKQTFAQPKVWIPIAAGVLIVAVAGTVAVASGGNQAVAGPSASPTPTVSESPATSASTAPSATPTHATSSSPSPSPSVSSTSEPVTVFAWPAPDDSRQSNVENGQQRSYLPVGYSADDTYVAVLQSNEESSWFELFGAGTGARALRVNGYSCFAWAPTGHTGVLASEASGKLTIYAIDAASGTKRVLAKLSGRDPRAVSVSPDGKLAVVTSVSGDPADVASYSMTLVALDGSSTKELGKGAAAVFGPDGSSIFFKGGDANGVALWKMNVDGTGATKVGAGAEQPNDTVGSFGGPVLWSPDGSVGVYDQYVDEYTAVLRSVRADGTRDTELAKAGNWASDISFSPDGSEVLAVTNVTSGGEVARVDMATGAVTVMKGAQLSKGGHIGTAGWLPTGTGFVVSFVGVSAQSTSYFVTPDEPGSPTAVMWAEELSAPPVWTSDGADTYWGFADTGAHVGGRLVHAWLER